MCGPPGRRSSRAHITYVWDGTRWLSTNHYERTLVPLALPPYSVDSVALIGPAWDNALVRIDDVYLMAQINGTNDASNFWTLSLAALNAAGAITATLASTSSALNGNNRATAKVSPNVITASLDELMAGRCVKTGAPGSVGLFNLSFTYRLVG
jgi:hypothetical protein